MNNKTRFLAETNTSKWDNISLISTIAKDFTHVYIINIDIPFKSITTDQILPITSFR